MRKSTGLATVAIVALGLTGCGDDEAAPEPQEEPRAVETASPEPTPDQTSPEPEPEPEPADPFLAGAEPHVEALDSWWEDYEDADCTDAQPDCYEIFHEGLGHLEDYEEWLTALDVSEVPDYVHFRHRGLVSRTLYFMEFWAEDCPGPECASSGLHMHDQMYDDVISEIQSW